MQSLAKGNHQPAYSDPLTSSGNKAPPVTDHFHRAAIPNTAANINIRKYV